MADEKERKNDKMEILYRNFSTARKFRRTARVYIASQYTLSSEADLSELLWLDLALRFAHALPIPYIQAAILNLLNPYIRSAIDTCIYMYIIIIIEIVMKEVSCNQVMLLSMPTAFYDLAYVQIKFNQCMDIHSHNAMQSPTFSPHPVWVTTSSWVHSY